MLIEFLDLAGGRFFKAELLINFHPFHKVVTLFGDKTISRRCTKGQFKRYWNFLKLCQTMNLEIVSQWRNNNQHSSWTLQGGMGGGGVGAYFVTSRWTLIRGWALNRINTVRNIVQFEQNRLSQRLRKWSSYFGVTFSLRLPSSSLNSPLRLIVTNRKACYWFLALWFLLLWVR